MTDIKIVSYNPHRDGDAYLAGVIDCYQKSFAGPPWNESHICTTCNQQYGAEEIETIPLPLTCQNDGCNGPLREYWTEEQIRADFFSETKRNSEESKTTSSWIALDEGQVVGICWGYTITPTKLVEKVELSTLQESLLDHFGKKQELFAYLDELAVLPEYRGEKFKSLGGCGVAKALVRSRHNDIFMNSNVEVAVVRTLVRPPTRTYEWYTGIGFTVIDHYPENPNRVILAKKFLRVEQSCFFDGCLLESF